MASPPTRRVTQLPYPHRKEADRDERPRRVAEDADEERRQDEVVPALCGGHCCGGRRAPDRGVRGDGQFADREPEEASSAPRTQKWTASWTAENAASHTPLRASPGPARPRRPPTNNCLSRQTPRDAARRRGARAQRRRQGHERSTASAPSSAAAAVRRRRGVGQRDDAQLPRRPRRRPSPRSRGRRARAAFVTTLRRPRRREQSNK